MSNFLDVDLNEQDRALLEDLVEAETAEKKEDEEEPPPLVCCIDLACEQALCLGKKNSKEREGKGGESL